MKFTQFILVFILFSFSLNAQNLAVGTKWIYHESGLNGLNGKAYNLQIVADTVINGKNCKKITGGKGCAALPKGAAYILIEAKKVYQYDFTAKTFRLLYDWNANVNDVITAYAVTATGAESFTYVVDSTGYWSPYGEALKVMKIRYTGNSKKRFASFYIIEKIGANTFFFPQDMTCSPTQWGSVRCFLEANKPQIKFVNYECDTTVAFLNATNEFYDKNIKIYPTPSVGTLNIEMNSRLESGYKVSIHDIMGRLKYESPTLTEANFRLETEDWTSGIYFITLKDKKGSTWTEKWIIR